jgi:hypothetical protein
MTFLMQLRDAAMQCSNTQYRALLRAIADHIETAIDNVRWNPTEETMRDLVGYWAKAERILKNVPPEGDPAPLGGSTEATKFALPAGRHQQRLAA